MFLNETIKAYDLAEALRDESGKFEVTTPSGKRFFVTSKPGNSISNLHPVPENGDSVVWRIRKVADWQNVEESVK